MLTYKFIIAKNGMLRLRLTNNRQTSEFSLELKMSEEELADATKIGSKAKNPAQRKYLANISTVLEDIKIQLLNEGRRDEDVKAIADIVRSRLFNKPVQTQKNIFKDFLLTIGQTKAKSTLASFEYTVNAMTKFKPNAASITFDDITYTWLSEFESWMKGKGMSQNTRKIHFGNIRIGMREAYKRELTNNDPFRRFTFRPEKTRKRSVTVEKLRELFNYPVEPFAEFYRDMFKLIFMLCGINTVDLFNLKSVTSDGRIEYKRAKTRRLYSIKVEPEAIEIINKYRGEKNLLCIADRWTDYKNFQHQMNNAIRRIGIAQGKGKKDAHVAQAPFAEITSYWARHSWASIARSIGVSKDDISLGLGHGDGNPVTSVYINEDLGAIDRANRKVLDWVLYNKK